MPSACGALRHLRISDITDAAPVSIVSKMLGVPSVPALHRDPAPCPVESRAAWNENRQAGITGTLRSGKVPLAWGSRKAREGLEDLRKERAESGGEPGEGGAN